MDYWVQKIVKQFRIVWGISILVLGAMGCSSKRSALPYYNSPDFMPLFVASDSVAQKNIHQIADFSFVNQEGQTVTQRNVEGKIHVANFMFTTCSGICPRMTEQMAQIAQAYAKDSSVVILSFSVTPWIDTPERLKAYKRDRQLNKNDWHFLTGNKSDIYRLARESYFAEEEMGFTKDSSDFLHTEHFLLIDAHKHIRGIYNGTLKLEAEQLIKDIAILKEERVNP